MSDNLWGIDCENSLDGRAHSMVTVTNGFFQGGSKVVFMGGTVSGVSITNNIFGGGGRETTDGDCTNNDPESLTHGVACGSHDSVAGGSVHSFGPDPVIIADNLPPTPAAATKQNQRVTRTLADARAGERD